MLVSLKYHKIRQGLGILAFSIMTVAYILSFAFTSGRTEEERVSLAYNLGIVVAIAWAYSSGIAKILMINGHGRYKKLNIIALLLLVLLIVLGIQSPKKLVPPSTFLVFHNLLLNLWVISWGVLDMCEIALGDISKP